MAQCFSENKQIGNGEFYDGVFTDSLYCSTSGINKPGHSYYPISTDKGHRRTCTDHGIPRNMNGASIMFEGIPRKDRDNELPKDLDFRSNSLNYGNIKANSFVSNTCGEPNGHSSKSAYEAAGITHESKDVRSIKLPRQSSRGSFDSSFISDNLRDASFIRNERRDDIGIQSSSRFLNASYPRKGEILLSTEGKPMHSNDNSAAYEKSRPSLKNSLAKSSKEHEVANNSISRLRSRNLSEGNFGRIFSGEDLENAVSGRKFSTVSPYVRKRTTPDPAGNAKPMHENEKISGTKPNYDVNPRTKALEHDVDNERDSRNLPSERTVADHSIQMFVGASSEGNSKHINTFNPIREATCKVSKSLTPSLTFGPNNEEISQNRQNAKANHHAGEILDIRKRSQSLNDMKLSEGRSDHKISATNSKFNSGYSAFAQGTLIVGKSSERSDGKTSQLDGKTSLKTLNVKDGDYSTNHSNNGLPKQEICSKQSGSEHKPRLAADAYKTGNIFSDADDVLLRKAFASKDAEEVKSIGNEQYRKGHFAEALVLYERAISLAPFQASYHSNRAAALSALGRLVDAVQECKEAIKFDSTYIRARRRLVSLLMRLGKFEDAKAHFYAAEQQIDGGDLQQIQNIESHIVRCLGARKLTDWKTVLRESDAAILAGADAAPEVLALKAEALLGLRRTDEAVQVLRTAKDLETDIAKAGVGLPNSTVLIVQARLDYSQGRYKEALVAAEKASQVNPNNAEVSSFLKILIAILKARKKGNEFFRDGKYFEASAAYGEGLESDSTNAVLLSNRAACRFNIGLWEKSIEDCDAALEAQPSYIKAHLRRAHSYAKLEKWEDALRDFEAVKRELPGNVEVAQALFNVQVALQKARGEEISKAQFGGELEEVSGIDQFSKAISSPGLAIVQFISRWSEKCKQCVPFVEQLCKSYPAVNFLTVDIEKIPYLAKSENITLVPTLKIYKNGQKMQELRGSSHQDLEQAVQHYTQ